MQAAKLLVWALCAMLPASLHASEPPSFELLPDTRIEVSLASDEASRFDVSLPAGMVADLGLIQRTGFVDLELQAAGSSLRVRTESGATGTIEAPLLAATSTRWLVILAARKGKGAASATLRLSAVHPATTSDELKSSAFQHYVDAERLRFVNYRESAVTARPADIEARTLAEYAAAQTDYTAANDGCGLRRASIGLSRLEVARGFYARAIEVADTALKADCRDDLAEQAQVLKTIGMAAAYQGDFTASAKWALQALALYRQTGDLRYQGIVLGNLSDVYMELGETDSALTAATGALDAAVATADGQGVVFSRKSIGAIHLARGDLATALQVYRQTLADLATTPYPRVEAETWNDLGIVYHRMADYEESLKAYAAAERLWKHMNDRAGAADTLINQAQTWLELGNTRAAVHSFEAALAIARTDGLKNAETGALRGLGEAQTKLLRLGTARLYFLQSLQLARASGAITAESYALRGLAAVDYRRGHLLAAQQFDETALQLAQNAGDRDGEAATLRQLACIVADRGGLSAAQKSIDAAIEIIETQRGQINDPGLRTSYFAAMREYSDTQINILMRLHARFPERAYAKAALAAADRARARSLQDMFSEKATEVAAGLPPALAGAQRRAEETLRTAAFQLTRPSVTATGRRQALTDAVDAASRALDEVRGEVRSADPRFADLVQPRMLSVDELQQRFVDDDGAILEYWLGSRASYVWVVQRHSFRVLRLKSRAAIESLAANLVARCRAPRSVVRAQGFAGLALAEAQQSAAITQSALRLAMAVMGPEVLRGLPRKIAIVADAALQGVPFGLLPLGAESRLGEEHDLSFLPSITTLAWLRPRAAAVAPGSLRIAVFAAPALDVADLPGLPYARIEAESITALWPKDQVWVALGAQATRDAVLSTDWSHYNIVHFATHASVDRRRPELSGIVLAAQDAKGKAQDGMLRMNDIYNLRMPVDLVVLSGCETAVGRGLDSEGVFSLSRAFFYAGAARVIASLWRVDDRATAAFMQEFYRALLIEHMPPASAMRFAQQRLASDNRWAAPYYWAGFILEGDWG